MNLCSYVTGDSTMLCKFALIGCPDGRCSRTHDLIRLKPVMCPDGKNCAADRRTADPRKTPCPLFHPGERTPRAEIVKRALEEVRPITRDSLYEKTRRCFGCMDPTECRHAHSPDEMRSVICPYGRLCPGETCRYHDRMWSDLDGKIDFKKRPLY